jgi:glycosyltransferase involved in cell wall biosynthesis
MAAATERPSRKPEVSVVIPTCNRWRLLSTAALPSALEQQDVEHEVVVVDEGSRDATATELERLGHPRLRVIRHDRPRGVAQARNAGIAAATGAWIAFLDDDDVWAPHKLRQQIDAAEASGASFAYCSAAWLDEHRRFLYGLQAPDPSGLPARLLRWNEIWAGGSNVLARADLVRELGGFDETLFQLADWDLWIRLALAGAAVALPELLVGYVMQPQSMLLTDRRDVFLEFDRLVAKHREAAARLGAGPDPLRFARWVALGHLRAGRRREAARTYLAASLRHRDASTGARALAALLGPTGLAAARAVARAARGADPARLDTVEPDWLLRYRDTESSPSTR